MTYVWLNDVPLLWRPHRWLGHVSEANSFNLITLCTLHTISAGWRQPIWHDILMPIFLTSNLSLQALSPSRCNGAPKESIKPTGEAFSYASSLQLNRRPIHVKKLFVRAPYTTISLDHRPLFLLVELAHELILAVLATGSVPHRV